MRFRFSAWRCSMSIPFSISRATAGIHQLKHFILRVPLLSHQQHLVSDSVREGSYLSQRMRWGTHNKWTMKNEEEMLTFSKPTVRWRIFCSLYPDLFPLSSCISVHWLNGKHWNPFSFPTGLQTPVHITMTTTLSLSVSTEIKPTCKWTDMSDLILNHWLT